MQLKEGRETGVWQAIPEAGNEHPGRRGNVKRRKHLPGVFPLFYSRPHAELFHRLTFNSSPDICVRGIEQPGLRFLILWADGENGRFAIMQPFMDGKDQKFAYEEWSARDLAEEYCMYDLSSRFKDSKFDSRQREDQ